VDPEFQKALIVVLAVGSIIGAIGTVTLVFVFRQFGEKRAGSSSHFGLMAALLIFIFAVCGALFLLSYR
jgi:ABC-type siderophore export system fused ATPase/permease subunit